MLYEAESSNSVLYDNLEDGLGWEVGGKFKKEGTYVYLWLTHVDVWQKPMRYCKAITPQLKTKKIKIKKNNGGVLLSNNNKSNDYLKKYIQHFFLQ